MLEFHQVNSASGDQKAVLTLMATEATRQQSLIYGCIVENKDKHTLEHYVDNTFITEQIVLKNA